MRAHTKRTADLVAELTEAVARAEQAAGTAHEISTARAVVRAAVRTLAGHLAAGNSTAMTYVTTTILDAWDRGSWPPDTHTATRALTEEDGNLVNGVTPAPEPHTHLTGRAAHGKTPSMPPPADVGNLNPSEQITAPDPATPAS